MKKIIFFLFILHLTPLLWKGAGGEAFAQEEQGNSRIDSLLTELSKTAEDTNKVNLLNRLSKSYQNTNPDKGIEFGKQSLEISKKLNWKKGIAVAYHRIGNNYYAKSDYPKAMENYLNSLKLHEELGNKHAISGAFNNIGLVYLEQKENSKSLEYFHKALYINEELGDKDRIASNLANIGSAK